MTRSWPATACSPARWPRPRRCSTCSPATRSATRRGRRGPVEPYATSVRRDPGRLRVAMTADNALGVDVDPECVRGMHVAGELLSSLGHDVVRRRAGASRLRCARPVHQRLRAGGRARDRLRRAAGGPAARGGRDRAAVARDLRPVAEPEPRSATWRAIGAATGTGARPGRLLRRVRPAAHARAGRAAAGDRRAATGSARTRWRTSPAPAASRRSPSLFNVTGQPAISVPVGFGDDGLPTAAQLVAQAARRGHAAAGRRADGGRTRPPGADPGPLTGGGSPRRSCGIESFLYGVCDR